MNLTFSWHPFRLARSWRLAAAAATAVLVVIPLVPPASAATEVTADVNAEEISGDDSVTLTVRISGESLPRSIEPPSLPPMVNLRAAAGPFLSSSFQWINGKTSASRVFSWQLLPLKEGPASISAIEVRVGNESFRTSPLEIKVTGTAVPRRRAPSGEIMAPPGGRSHGREVLVRAEVDRLRPFVGEPVVLTYKLLTRAPIARISPERMPSFKGFLADDITVAPAETRRRVVEGGLAFDEYVVARKVLSATDPGTRRIEPAAFRITAELLSDEDDIFQRFFRGSMREIMRETEPVVIEVRPLPADGRPADFSGAVGKFALRVSADRSEAATGDAVGFRVTVEGTGELRTAGPPGVPKLHDFRVYDPKLEEKTSLEGTQRHVTRSWNYVLVPLAPGEQEIPAIRFPYFDPEEGAYRVASAGPTALSVRRTAEPVGAPVAVAKQEIVQLRQELHYLKPLDRPLVFPAPPLYRQGRYLALLAVPLLAPLVVSAWGALAASGAEARGRRRRARRAAKRAIDRASRLDSAGRVAEFYDALSSGLIESMAKRWNVSASGLTYDRLEEGLAGSGVSDATRRRFRTLLETCDTMRFAPSPAAGEDRRRHLAEARDLLASVQQECRGRLAEGRAGPAVWGALALLAALLVSPGALAAGTPGTGEEAEAFQQASTAYEAGRFSEAASLFQKVLDHGYGEQRVHYNLSCALFRAGDIGRALLHAEIAAALDPADRDARENLDFMRLQLVDRAGSGSAFGSEPLLGAIESLSAFAPPNFLALAVFGAEGFSVLFATLALRARRQGQRSRLGPLAGAALAVALILASALAAVAWRRESVREGVILPEKAEALAGPGPSHPALFAVHAGLKIRIQGEREGWLQVVVPSGLSGWLREEEVGKIVLE